MIHRRRFSHESLLFFALFSFFLSFLPLSSRFLTAFLSLLFLSFLGRGLFRCAQYALLARLFRCAQYALLARLFRYAQYALLARLFRYAQYAALWACYCCAIRTPGALCSRFTASIRAPTASCRQFPILDTSSTCGTCSPFLAHPSESPLRTAYSFTFIDGQARRKQQKFP